MKKAKPNLVITFEPFGGNFTNGSTTIGTILAEELGWEHRVLSVRWDALESLEIDIGRYGHILGLGEGYHHFIGVERMARRGGTFKDVDGNLPSTKLVGTDEETLVCHDLRWEHRWMTQTLLESLHLPGETLGIMESGCAGPFVCNGLFYWLLRERRRQQAVKTLLGFIHDPDETMWTCRTGRSDYGPIFANANGEILRRNDWLSRAR